MSIVGWNLYGGEPHALEGTHWRIPLRVAGAFRWLRYASSGDIIAFGRFKNGVTNTALNTLLDSFFRNTAPPTTWYLGLIDNASFSALAGADTMASHAGWLESTTYTEATRPQWVAAAAAGQVLTNPVAAAFTTNAAATLKGLFLTSNNTKAGTTGTLWCTGLFDATQSLQAGEAIKVFYDLEAREG